MKTVYEFLDYREYLNAYVAYKKERNPHFSVRMLGGLLDIDASYLVKILKGVRHLSAKSLPRVMEYLKFSTAEQHYFKTLVNFNKARTEEQRRANLETLLTLRKPHTTNIESHQYQFYKKWYYTALRNLLEFYPFHKDDDYRALGLQLSPQISEKAARETIELLERLELISLDSDNRYVLTDNAITTGENWRSLAIKDYQVETIELSRQSLDRHPKEVRDVSTVTMNITEAEFDKIREMIQQLRSSVVNYVSDVENPDRVYQLNMQLIPLCQNGSDLSSGE